MTAQKAIPPVGENGRPTRVQLSRAKGWRMPPNTIKVDRTTRFGNPAIVGPDGSAPECVYLYLLMLAGYIVCRAGIGDRQQAAMKVLKAEKQSAWRSLRGRNLACWCAPTKPCHADVLLHVANRKPRARRFDLNAYLAKHGYRMENGRAVRLAPITDRRVPAK